MRALLRVFDRLALGLAIIGALIIVVQMLWISYGVFMRYVLSNPDGTVTEATALLLFPTAFLGLAFALKESAYPKVTFLFDVLKPSAQRWLEALNLLLMILVAGFFAVAAVQGTIGSFRSGSASEILHWPRYLFWTPATISLLFFTAYAILKLVDLMKSSSDETFDTTASRSTPQ